MKTRQRIAVSFQQDQQQDKLVFWQVYAIGISVALIVVTLMK